MLSILLVASAKRNGRLHSLVLGERNFLQIKKLNNYKLSLLDHYSFGTKKNGNIKQNHFLIQCSLLILSFLKSFNSERNFLQIKKLNNYKLSLLDHYSFGQRRTEI